MSLWPKDTATHLNYCNAWLHSYIYLWSLLYHLYLLHISNQRLIIVSSNSVRCRETSASLTLTILEYRTYSSTSFVWLYTSLFNSTSFTYIAPESPSPLHITPHSRLSTPFYKGMHTLHLINYLVCRCDWIQLRTIKLYTLLSASQYASLSSSFRS